MSTEARGVEVARFRRELRHELEAIRGRWIWLLILGIVLVAFGMFAIAAPFISSLATVLTIGVLLIMAGVAQLAGAFWTRDWSGFFLVLLMGVLYAVMGVLFLNRPLEAMAAVTLLLACVLLVGGAFRTIVSAWHQFPQWGWVFVGGLLQLGMGLLIWQGWPETSLWVVGLFVGIDMIFTGWTWVALSLRLKRLGDRIHPQAPAGPTSPAPA